MCYFKPNTLTNSPKAPPISIWYDVVFVATLLLFWSRNGNIIGVVPSLSCFSGTKMRGALGTRAPKHIDNPPFSRPLEAYGSRSISCLESFLLFYGANSRNGCQFQGEFCWTSENARAGGDWSDLATIAVFCGSHMIHQCPLKLCWHESELYKRSSA